MSPALERQTAVYTARPEAYAGVDADVLSGQTLTATPTAEEFVDTKKGLLDRAEIIVVDFKGFSHMIPFTFLIGGIRRIVSGGAYAVAGVGTEDIPVEQFTKGTTESAGWLGELYQQL